MKTMTKILLFCITLSALSSAQPNNDQDMDGVPDTLDQCSNTPFLGSITCLISAISALVSFSQ